MELYNFFTEVADNDEKIKLLLECYDELTQIYNDVHLIKFESRNGTNYSIIGQIYGDDTSLGDSDLVRIFYNTKYTWFNAFYPTISNIR